MNTNLHLVFPGTCREAFAFYEKTFASRIQATMTFGETPSGTPPPPGAKDLILHTSMPLGGILLMGCDAPEGRWEPFGGFQIAVDAADEAEVRRLFGALSEGGSVLMPPTPTFWSPLFGMLKDRFGIGWMVSVPGPR